MSDTVDDGGAAVTVEGAPVKRGGMQRVLDGIEKVGNKVPHPAIIFVGLCVLVIVLSAILAAFDVSVTYDVAVQPPPRGYTLPSALRLFPPIHPIPQGGVEPVELLDAVHPPAPPRSTTAYRASLNQLHSTVAVEPLNRPTASVG